jgi:hypothetical protein
MSLWPMYSDSPLSRWLAAGVIAIATLYFALVGLGVLKDRYLTASATVSSLLDCRSYMLY